MTNCTQQYSKELQARLAKTQDGARLTQAQKRHAKGFNTARENIEKLCSLSCSPKAAVAVLVIPI